MITSQLPTEQPAENNCSNCFWWLRVDEEHGECRRYAPTPIEYHTNEDRKRPITPQYWKACGDWQKII